MANPGQRRKDLSGQGPKVVTTLRLQLGTRDSGFQLKLQFVPGLSRLKLLHQAKPSLLDVSRTVTGPKLCSATPSWLKLLLQAQDGPIIILSRPQLCSTFPGALPRPELPTEVKPAQGTGTGILASLEADKSPWRGP